MVDDQEKSNINKAPPKKQKRGRKRYSFRKLVPVYVISGGRAKVWRLKQRALIIAFPLLPTLPYSRTNRSPPSRAAHLHKLIQYCIDVALR